MWYKICLKIALRQNQRVVIVIVCLARHPAREFGALFEGGMAFAQKISFAHAHAPERAAHGWPGSLAHTDNRDIGGFDQRDLQRLTVAGPRMRGERSGGQPTGCSPAYDDNFPDRPGHDLVFYSSR